MNKRDYYEVLNLNNTCTPQEVKKNFHKLALVWHPDKHSNKTEAEGKFKEIHEAYCVLMDENKRKIYDTLGHSGLSDTLEKRNCTPFNPANFCSQGPFGKSKKSPFEMFCNIFKDKEDEEEDDFYKTFFDCDRRNMCNLINNNIKSFFEDAFESSENEENEQFFNRYRPTFMDTDFFSTPSLFKTFECESELSSSELFSSFFQSAGSGTQSFSRTSTTFANGKGNCKTSIKQRFQSGDKVFENEQQYVFNGNCAGKSKEKNCLNNKRTAKSVAANKNKDFIVIEDSDNEEEASNNKKDALNGNENIPNRRATPKACPFTNTQFNFDFIHSDDDFNLLFSNMERLGTCRKSKK